LANIWNITVYPNSKFSEVKQIDENTLEIRIKSPPIKGKANKELIELLSKFFNVKKSQIKIVKGLTSRNKVVQIE